MRVKRILVGIFLFSAVVAHAQTREELRAVWLTNVDSNVLFSDKSIAEAMDYLASIGINTVFPVVWNKGYTLYPSEVMRSRFTVPIIQDFAGRDPLKRVIIEAHRNGMEVIPWFEFGFSSSYSLNGGHIVAKYPHWAGKNSAGQLLVKNGFDWLAGTNPEVQNFMISLITEVIDNYDVDGVQGDDRLPAMPIEGGYDSVTVALYKAEHQGAAPPLNVADPAWTRWRASKLSQCFQRLRDSVKTRSTSLIVSSTPSPYPWGYENYLQDSKTWVDQGIADNLIPQLYRYSLDPYIVELDKSLSYIPVARKGIFFAGVLAKVGSYVITPELLIQSLTENRKRGVKGESFFFYEAFRLNNNRLGDTLKALFYQQPAVPPLRQGKIWRPKAVVVNEEDPTAVRSGEWRKLNFPGFKPNFFMAGDTGTASLSYSFDVPVSGTYDLYIYVVANYINSSQAPYTVYSSSDSSLHRVDQSNAGNNGWLKLRSAHLNAGRQKVVVVSNRDIGTGKLVVADAAMIMLNRKLSPDVVVTSVEKKSPDEMIPGRIHLEQNYPNPFNPRTTIRYSITEEVPVLLKLYTILGKEVATLVNEVQKAGIYSVPFEAGSTVASLGASGVYFYRLSAGRETQTRAMLFLK